MFGKTDLLLHPVFLIAVSLFSVISIATDISRGKIYNWLTYPALALGLGFSVYMGGLTGLLDSVLGLLLGFVCFSWIFMKGMMGGGDLKLLMALGAWGGPGYVLKTALLSILLGGMLSAVLLTQQKKLFPFIDKLKIWIASIYVKELRESRPEVDRKLTMPFGIPLAIAASWIAWADPFKAGGLFGW